VRADDGAASAAWVPAVGRVGGATVAVNADRHPRRAAALRDACVATVEAMQRDEPARDPVAGRAQPGGPGRVSIVGGGPGDPGLITVAGRERLRRADVVVTDRLAPLELLAGLAPDVEIIDAAKVPSGPGMRQESINRLLVSRARAGRSVVRLKGGDPFVFGRGREEADACLAAGVPFDVVPGVTSAVSVPAAAGIPVTHRGLSQGFTVVTGHVSPDHACRAVDWAALAASGTTIVALMAVEQAAGIAEALMAAGMTAGTPAACVADGWSRQQRVVTAALADLAPAMKEADISNPAVLIIGETARYAAHAGPSGPG
jgi:uroporphyrin-III C-methyltransferase/precorrin-2 dehydrogenase/sirohydrochlorin ferrochelatase